MIPRLVIVGGVILSLAGCSSGNYNLNNHTAYLKAKELPTLKLVQVGEGKSPNKRYDIPMVFEKKSVEVEDLAVPPDFR